MLASHQICQMNDYANFDFNLHKIPKFSAPSAPILTYLYRIYAYKTLFFKLFGAAGDFFSICTSFLTDFSVKTDDFQRESWNPFEIFRWDKYQIGI